MVITIRTRKPEGGVRQRFEMIAMFGRPSLEGTAG
jgi:hypothetical protein